MIASRTPTDASFAAMPAPRGEAWQARLLTGALFMGYLPQSLLSGRSPGDTLEAVRGAVAQVFALPG